MDGSVAAQVCRDVTSFVWFFSFVWWTSHWGGSVLGSGVSGVRVMGCGIGGCAAGGVSGGAWSGMGVWCGGFWTRFWKWSLGFCVLGLSSLFAVEWNGGGGVLGWGGMGWDGMMVLRRGVGCGRQVVVGHLALFQDGFAAVGFRAEVVSRGRCWNCEGFAPYVCSEGASPGEVFAF